MEPTVVHVSPHPDDELIGSPATLMALRDSGWRVLNVACGLGRPDQEARRLAELREACGRARFELLLSTDHPGLGLRDDRARTEDVLARHLGDILRSSDAAVVVSPSPHDAHHGHEVVARAVRRAVEAVAAPPTWLMWGLWSDLPIPNATLGFDEPRLTEISFALEAHAGEVQRNDYVKLVRERAALNARLGAERVFGFGAQALDEPYAELLTRVTFASGMWSLAEPQTLIQAALLTSAPTATDIGWWLMAPSIRDSLRAGVGVHGQAGRA